MANELDLQKARGKSLAHHFTKVAAFHEKKADHHEKCMKAHEAIQEHHEAMGKVDGADKEHHKAKAAFHKTKAGLHEKMHKLCKAHAEHHATMAAAHSENPDSAKAAFTILGIEVLEKAAIPATDPQPTPTGEPTVIKTDTPSTAAGTTDPKAAASGAQPNSTAQAAAQAAMADGDPLGVQKVFNEGVATATVNAVKELLASPEFKKTIQEEVANTLLKRLGEQAQTTTVKTFAVPRIGTSVLEKARDLATGTTPPINTEGVSADFADLVSMGSGE